MQIQYSITKHVNSYTYTISLQEHIMDDNSSHPQKRKHWLVLDPSYQKGMMTNKTQKVWEEKYKHSLQQYEC